MQNSSTADAYRRVVLCLFVLGLFAALFIVPQMFNTEAVVTGQNAKGLFNRTESHQPNLENYDIRTDKSEEVSEALLRFRRESGKTASAIADTKENFVRGEENLRTRVKSLKVEYNSDLRIPEVITPDVYKAKIERLSAPSAAGIKNAEILRNFAKQNNELVGMNNTQLDNLKVLNDATNPRGNMAFATLEQRIHGIPVFRGEIKAGFTVNGEIVRVINNLAPGLDYESLSKDFGDPLDAVRAAADSINYKLQRPDVTRNDAASDDLKVVFGEGDWATTAEKMYFPTEVGVARPSWRVLIWQPVTAYYVIVDAETGTMLWRKNIGEDQTQAATYEVYANSNAFINAADSPAPLTPGPTDPTLGTQGVNIARTNITAIGNEAPNWGMNNLGWMTDNTNMTDGNNVEAGIDRDGTDGVDAPQMGDSACPGAGCRVFTSPTWSPPPGGASAPLDPAAQRGAVIHMFYVMNLYHDVLYHLGFTEQFFNFQNDNFGRGGTGNDRVRAEGQDSIGTNNANFLTPADGGRGRMQMFIWTGPSPDYDGTTDTDVIIHEVTHGTSNRLHGNASGLGTNMARGMGEGWSDYYGHILTSEPTDPINGTYTTGGYVTFLLTSGTDTSNYYYGIRRFPKAVFAFTGGPGNLPHNPLTFANLNAGNCSTFNGAFPRGPVGSATCDQVHNAGEIWSSALWEVRSLMVTRLGWAAGSLRALQVVTDGMKLAPLNPTFLQERDAIIAAAAALPAVPEASADVADVREGFRIRGMGFSASIQSISPASVTEAFDFPNVQHVDPFSVSDSTGDNDGFPEPGENVLLSIPVTNATGATINNVTVSVSGGAAFPYGNINDGQTVTMNVPYTVPGGAACGSFHQVSIEVASDAGVQAPVNRQFRLGSPVGGPAQTFENTTVINIPAGQPGSTSGPAGPYPSTIAVSGLTGNKVIELEINTLNHTWIGDIDMLLESPAGQKMIIMSDAFSSNNRTNTVVTTIKLRDDATDTMTTSGLPPTAATFKPFNSGANDPFDAPAPGTPYENPAPAGSATLLSAFGMDGSTMNGDWKLWIDDDAGGDPGTMDGGWKITFESDDYQCNLGPSAGDGRADFDGDGRTDLSVFRPSEGNWYLNQSTDGFSVLNWGQAGDTLVPGDYDGDGKTDAAVFRPDANPANADFYVLNSNGFTFSGYSWGLPGDVPVVGDYDGDGNDDIAVWRDSDATWYIIRSSGGATITAFGASGDTPTVGDFDGDGTADMTIFNAGTWTSMLSGGGTEVVNVGAAGDAIASGDHDGDGQTDQATFRASNGNWYAWLSSTNSQVIIPFGAPGDIAAPGDYDGDGTDDQAIYRGGQWWINGSTSGVMVQSFGVASDTPVVSRANP